MSSVLPAAAPTSSLYEEEESPFKSPLKEDWNRGIRDLFTEQGESAVSIEDWMSVMQTAEEYLFSILSSIPFDVPRSEDAVDKLRRSQDEIRFAQNIISRCRCCWEMQFPDSSDDLRPLKALSDVDKANKQIEELINEQRKKFVEKRDAKTNLVKQ